MAQSNRILEKNLCSCESVHSTFSKIRLLRSSHMVQNKHEGTIFQILNWCFPKQLCQPKNKSATQPGNTHKIPKCQNTKLHISYAIKQCSNKWLIVSFLSEVILFVMFLIKMSFFTTSINIILKPYHLNKSRIHVIASYSCNSQHFQAPFPLIKNGRRMLNSVSKKLEFELWLTGSGRCSALCLLPPSQTQLPSAFTDTNPDKFLTDITAASL